MNLESIEQRHHIAHLLRDAALKLEAEDNLDAAIEYMEVARKLKPTGPYIKEKLDGYYIRKIDHCVGNGNFADAQKYVESLDASDYEKRMLLAKCYYKTKQYGALRHLVNSIKVENYTTNFFWNVAKSNELISSTPSEDEIRLSWNGKIDPVISIVCITYNHKDYIEEAICSFLRQNTSVPFEIIVHDDASTDGTQHVITDYAQRYPNIIKPVCQTKNQYSLGVKPRLEMAKSANGQFISYCEGDDYWISPHKLEQQYKALLDNPNVFSCIHGFHSLNETNYACKHRFNLDELPYETRILEGTAVSKLDTELLRVNTLMHRKVEDMSLLFPEEVYRVEAGDQFCSSVLGTFGDAAFLKGFRASVYRYSGKGAWSGKSNILRDVSIFSLYCWMHKYYSRVNNDELSELFYERAKNRNEEIDSFLHNQEFDNIYLSYAKSAHAELFFSEQNPEII